MAEIKILALGDVVGKAAVDYIRRRLPGFLNDKKIDFTVINGENASDTNGLDLYGARELLQSGADVITSGNHIWRRNEIRNFLDDSDRVIRPANYRSSLPGQGYTLRKSDGYIYLVMNVMGVSYMDPLDNPFMTVEKILEREKGSYDISILDIHAEATGEKYALARYFDGKIDIMFGTHTHIPTADNRILPKGSGFVCDLGMCGAENGVLGMKSENVIEKLITNIPQKFEVADGKISCDGVIFTYDTAQKRVVDTERVKI